MATLILALTLKISVCFFCVDHTQSCLNIVNISQVSVCSFLFLMLLLFWNSHLYLFYSWWVLGFRNFWWCCADQSWRRTSAHAQETPWSNVWWPFLPEKFCWCWHVRNISLGYLASYLTIPIELYMVGDLGRSCGFGSECHFQWSIIVLWRSLDWTQKSVSSGRRALHLGRYPYKQCLLQLSASHCFSATVS